MHITINGKPHELDGAANIQALTERLGLNATQIAVERNREIVPRSRWGEVALAESDEIEIVRFIGGG